MKKLFTLFVIIASTFNVLAQSPQMMSYQCVVRNSSGELVTNQAVGMKVSILQGTSIGTVVFSETYSPNPQTNANGLISIEIGNGTPETGTFTGINWAEGPYFLKTETDPAGGTSYTIVGTSQLLSVPYALYSKMSGDLADNSVTSAKIADGNVATADLADGSVNSSKITDGSVATSDLAANSVTTDKINAGAVTGAKISQAGATSGQALKWNGTTWAPGTDLTGVSLWNQNGANIYYNAGAVGIGTITPNGYLDIYGNTNSGFAHLLLTENEADFARLMFKNAVTSSKNWTIAGGIDATDANSFLNFYYWNGSTGKNFISIAGNGNINLSGNVGIGISSPAAQLHTLGTGTGQGNVVFVGQWKNADPGDPPVSGAGTRMMWYPDKAAFRAGYVLDSEWDADNIGSFSTAMGSATVASGSYSTAMGHAATASGSYSTSMGYGTSASSFSSIALGSFNVGGGNALSWVSTDPLFEIGNGTSVFSTSNIMTILKNGYVGFGTASPAAGLHIKANTWPGSFIYLEANTAQDAGIRLYEGSIPKWHIFNNTVAGGLHIYNNAMNTAIFCQQSNSYVGIGTTTPFYILQVGNYGDGTQARANAWNILSDARLKKDLTGLTNPLEMVRKINGYYFFWNTGTDKTRQVGFSAQEVLEVIPEAVSKGEDGYLSIEYGKMTPLLLEAIKELKAENDKLKVRLKKIESLLYAEEKK